MVRHRCVRSAIHRDRGSRQLHPGTGLCEKVGRQGRARRARRCDEALLRAGPEGEARGHRNLQGGIQFDRCGHQGWLWRSQHHQPTSAVPARERANRRRTDRQQEGQDRPEVHRGEDAGEGCGLRGDLRHEHAA